MEKKYSIPYLKMIFCLMIILISTNSFSQDLIKDSKAKSEFWQHVQFGGGFGLGFGTGYTDISLSPNAIYNFNNYFSAGIGLQGSYVNVKNNFSSIIYGASMVTFINPIEEIQLSVELEQVRVNRTIEGITNTIKDNFWNTGLFFGAGYRSDNFTVGLRYNVLHDSKKGVYNDALMPFVRFYF